MNDAVIVVLMSFVCFNYTQAVEIYTAGRNGKLAWRETSEMRDRSSVPRPSEDDIQTDYRRRNKIPSPLANNPYRSRSSSIPRPSAEDTQADYKRRSKIPLQRTVSYRSKSEIPVPPAEGSVSNLQRREAKRKYLKQKKNIREKIFFTLPFGAQFPIHFVSRSRKGASKKSGVAAPAALRQKYEVPYRLQTWALPMNYQPLNSKRFLIPVVKNQAIARQQIFPRGGSSTSLGYNRRYLGPQPFYNSRLLSNRNIIPYPIYRQRVYTDPSTLRTFINRRIRSTKNIKTSKNTEDKDDEPSRKAVIDRQRKHNALSSTKSRDLPESSVNKELENIFTKLLIVI